jgi:hypothetical protein
MDSPNCKKRVVDTLFIFVALINFGEQMFIYALTKLADIDDEREKLFFWIIIGIATVSIFKVLIKSTRKQIIVSAFIEVGEVIVYCVNYYGTLYALKTNNIETVQPFLQNNIMPIITGALCVIELALLVIIFAVVEPSENSNTCSERLINLLIETSYFVCRFIVQVIPIFYLHSKSPFRSVFYEMLTAITLLIQTETVSFNPSFDFAVRKYCARLFRLLKKAICCQESVGNIVSEMKAIIREYTISVKKALHICHSRIGRLWFYFITIAQPIMGITGFITGIVYFNRELADGNFDPYGDVLKLYQTVFLATVFIFFLIPFYLVFGYQIYIYCKRPKVSPMFHQSCQSDLQARSGQAC